MNATAKRTTTGLLAVLLVVGMSASASAAAPNVSGFTPASGPPGTQVTVNGSGFTGVNAVAFNGSSTTWIFVNDGQLTTTVPLGATTGKVSVTTPGGTGQSASNFTVTGPPPVVSGFSPSSGPAGTLVTITGSNFTGVNGVKFNNTSATFTFVNAGQVNATVPAGATTGKISVTTPSGTGQSSSNFTVSSATTPTISSFSPTSGPPGTSVTILGTNLSGATAVKFNNKSATFNVINAGQITATVPSGATTGKISVTTPGGTASSSSSFTVTSATAPTIASFSPISGSVGSSVTVIGTNFTNVSSVKFNGHTATFAVHASTQLTATVPSGATTGKITVTTPAGTATSSANFTVTIVPTISSFSPSSGVAGTSVTINGSNFTGATLVRFNGVGASFSVQNSSRINATVPSGSTTGTISVTTPAGTATSSAVFTVTGGVHERTVTLGLSGRLIASGRVGVNDGYDACRSNVPVVIKRYHKGEWHWATTTSTKSDGSYRAYVRNRRGTYRARAKKVTLANGAICGGDMSNTVHHRH